MILYFYPVFFFLSGAVQMDCGPLEAEVRSFFFFSIFWSIIFAIENLEFKKKLRDISSSKMLFV